jgi:hypothetical protein
MGFHSLGAGEESYCGLPVGLPGRKSHARRNGGLQYFGLIPNNWSDKVITILFLFSYPIYIALLMSMSSTWHKYCWK